MSQFLFVLATAAALVCLYLVARQLRRLAAWIMNTDAPKERMIPFAVVIAMLGGIAGGIAHKPVMAAVYCHDIGQPILSCLMSAE